MTHDPQFPSDYVFPKEWDGVVLGSGEVLFNASSDRAYMVVRHNGQEMTLELDPTQAWALGAAVDQVGDQAYDNAVAEGVQQGIVVPRDKRERLAHREFLGRDPREEQRELTRRDPRQDPRRDSRSGGREFGGRVR